MKVNPLYERHYDEPMVDVSLVPEYFVEAIEVPGGFTPSQYGIPEGAKDLQDLIEYREMNFALGNIFKACYRMGTCSHSDRLRDLNKIRWFVERLIKEEERK